MRLDIHLNLGDIPTTKKGTKLFVSPSRIKEYIEKNEITHAAVIYSNLDYALELIEIAPQIVFYFFQWITNIKKIELSEIDKGICIHSHRGTLDGKSFGLDYSKISRYFNDLPDDTIIYSHLQGVPSYGNVSRAMSVNNWALNHPNLKFLMEHSGSYMRQDFYPKLNSYEELVKSKMAAQFYKQAVGSEACISEACIVSRNIPNTFMDSSIFLGKNYKTDLLSKNLGQWSYGSDYPFNLVSNVKAQEAIMRANYPLVDNEKIHQKGVDWIDSCVDDLWNNFFKKVLL